MSNQVSSRREKFHIPIVPLLSPDPNPVLPGAGYHAIYPYTRTHRFGPEPVDREMDAIILENDLLNVQVVPALGGRLWGSNNRLTNRPLFYTPPRVGMVNFGMRGAWYIGGIEFNFPEGHTSIANETIPALQRRHPDGAASAIVGDVDLIEHAGWSIGIRLQPGCSSVFFDILLYNRTSLPIVFSWWMNAAVPTSPQLEYTNATTEVRSHMRGASELVTWPVYQSQDFRWYKQNAGTISLFHLAGDDRWYGYYLHDQDQGVVRLGSAAEAPGLKFFSAGQSEEGYLWGKQMTAGERFSNTELQTGRPETQTDNAILPAHQSLRWTEVWRPVWGLGGLTCASEAVALHWLPEENGSVLRLLSDRLYQGCTLNVVGTGINQSFPCNLFPDHPVSFPLPVPATCKSLQVEVLNANGERLFSFNRPLDQERRSVMADVLQIRPGPEMSPQELIAGEKSAEELTLEAEKWERQRQPLDARRLAKKALAIDPGFTPAHLLLARGDLLSANYEQARRHCLDVLWRDPTNEAAQYFLALTDLWQGDPKQAEIEFEHLLGHCYLISAAAWLELAQLRIARKEWRQALHALKRCLERESNQVKAHALRANVYRHLGQLEAAKQALVSAVELAPLDPLVRVERWQLASPGRTATPWEWNLSSDDRDQYFELRPPSGLLQDAMKVACDYLACGLLEDAESVLEVTLASIPDPDPLALYLLGALKEQVGKQDAAKALWKTAARHRGRYVYSSRREEELALRAALKHQPEDGLAHALLGMLEVYRLNPQKAIPELEHAIQLRPKWEQPIRLLAICQRMLGNTEEAAHQLELAVAASPEDPQLYVELDELLATLPEGSGRRKKLWSKFPVSVIDDEDAHGRYASFLVDNGQYARAIKTLEGHAFYPVEGSSFYRDLFSLANLGLALKAADEGHANKALRYAQQASSYPEHLGLGAPNIRYDAATFVLEAALFHHQGKDKAARAKFNQAANEQHRETNEAEYFSGLAYRWLDQEGKAQEKFKQLLKKSDVDTVWPGSDREFGVLMGVLGRAGIDHKSLSSISLEGYPPSLHKRLELYGRLSELTFLQRIEES